MLRVTNVKASYGRIQVLHGISFEVNAGEIVTLIGSNGAGKTTALSCINRLLKNWTGSITFENRELISIEPEEIVKLGVATVPENRGLFGPMSVHENLVLGAYKRFRTEKKAVIKTDLEKVFELFPILKERLKQTVATLSGGQQQMVAIGKALMAKPKLLILDEPSLGLAPLVIREIFQAIRLLNQQGVTILLVEQNANLALNVANRGYLLENGSIVMGGEAKDLLSHDEIREAYLGKRG